MGGQLYTVITTPTVSQPLRLVSCFYLERQNVCERKCELVYMIRLGQNQLWQQNLRQEHRVSTSMRYDGGRLSYKQLCGVHPLT